MSHPLASWSVGTNSGHSAKLANAEAALQATGLPGSFPAQWSNAGMPGFPAASEKRQIPSIDQKPTSDMKHEILVGYPLVN